MDLIEVTRTDHERELASLLETLIEEHSLALVLATLSLLCSQRSLQMRQQRPDSSATVRWRQISSQLDRDSYTASIYNL